MVFKILEGEMYMPFCENCGTKLSDTAKFCPNCGHKAVGAASADQTNPVASAPDEPIKETTAYISNEQSFSKNDLIAFLGFYASRLNIIDTFLTNLVMSDFEIKEHVNLEHREPQMLKCIDWNAKELDREYIKKDILGGSAYFGSFLTQPALRSIIYSYDPAALVDDELLRKYLAAQSAYRECAEKSGNVAITFNFAGQYQDEVLTFPLASYYPFPSFGANSKTEFAKDLEGYGLARFIKDISYFSHRDFSGQPWDVNPKTGLKIIAADGQTLLGQKAVMEYETLYKTTKTTGLFIKKEVTEEHVRNVENSCIADLYAYLLKRLDIIQTADIKNGQSKLLTVVFDSVDEIIKSLGPVEKVFNLPYQYRTAKDALALAQILSEGKADTWKEAVTLYDTETYRKRVLGSLVDIKKGLQALNQTVSAFGKTSLQISASVLGEMKTANTLLAEQKKKLESIAKSTFITAVFDD